MILKILIQRGSYTSQGEKFLSENYNASSKIVCHHQKGGECKIKILKCTFVLMKTNHEGQRRQRLLIKLKVSMDKVFGSSTQQISRYNDNTYFELKIQLFNGQKKYFILSKLLHMFSKQKFNFYLGAIDFHIGAINCMLHVFKALANVSK